MSRFTLCGLFLILCIGIGGCTSPYVHIPKRNSRLASSNPNSKTVAHVMRSAMRRVVMKYPPPGQFSVRLPEGTNDMVYAHVLDALPEGGMKQGATAEAFPTYEILRVYVSGLSAQVEIIRPAFDGREERLVSVFLRPDVIGWYADRHRMWDLPVQEALFVSRPEPEFEETPEKPGKTEIPTKENTDNNSDEKSKSPKSNDENDARRPRTRLAAEK